jgi:hypothetical protein
MRTVHPGSYSSYAVTTVDIVRENQRREAFFLDGQPWARQSSPLTAWQLVLGLAGAAAGFGALVVVVGAIALAIRFSVAGVPVGAALPLVAKSRFVVVGAEVLAWPALCIVGLWGLTTFLLYRSQRRIAEIRLHARVPEFEPTLNPEPWRFPVVADVG